MNRLILKGNRATNLLDNVRASFWAIPCALIVLAILLAILVTWFDASFASTIDTSKATWAWISGIDGTRGALATTAGAILGVAGVSFSMTIASLTLASQQFGPRLIRNFMRDRFIQMVLGFFTATFVYCMLTMLLSDVVTTSNYAPVSTLGVTMTLVIVDLLLLILFLHHICVAIQVDTVIADISRALICQVESLQQKKTGLHDMQQVSTLAGLLDAANESFPAAQDGYLRYIDYDGLLKFAEDHDLLIRVKKRAGDYICCGVVLFECVCVSVSRETSEALSDAERFFVIDETPTQIQDVEYSIRQLVEIALRALSPGVNDPFTAITCIDRIGSMLNRMAQTSFAASVMADSDGTLRLMLKNTNFTSLVEVAFNQIRQNSVNQTDVTVRLLETIDTVVQLAPDNEQCKPLVIQAQMIMKKLQPDTFAPIDYVAIEERYQQLTETIRRRALTMNMHVNTAE